MPDRCGHVRRDRLTFELFQAEDGFEEFASCILAAKWKNSHLYFTFSYSHCEAISASPPLPRHHTSVSDRPTPLGRRLAATDPSLAFHAASPHA